MNPEEVHSVLQSAVELGQKSGIYTLRDISLILTALETINPANQSK